MWFRNHQRLWCHLTNELTPTYHGDWRRGRLYREGVTCIMLIQLTAWCEAADVLSWFTQPEKPFFHCLVASRQNMFPTRESKPFFSFYSSHWGRNTNPVSSDSALPESWEALTITSVRPPLPPPPHLLATSDLPLLSSNRALGITPPSRRWADTIFQNNFKVLSYCVFCLLCKYLI